MISSNETTRMGKVVKDFLEKNTIRRVSAFLLLHEKKKIGGCRETIHLRILEERAHT